MGQLKLGDGGSSGRTEFIASTPLRFYFKTWAAGARPWKQHSVFGLVRPWLMRMRVWAEAWCSYLHDQTAIGLNKAYVGKVEQQSGESTDDINSSDAKTKFSAIKRLTPVQHRAISHVKREDGTQTFTKHEANLAFADYFSGGFGASRVPFATIVERERKDLGNRLVAARGICKQADLIQTELDLCRRFAGMTPFQSYCRSTSWI